MPHSFGLVPHRSKELRKLQYRLGSSYDYRQSTSTKRDIHIYNYGVNDKTFKHAGQTEVYGNMNQIFFAMIAKVKKLKDKKANGGENEIPDAFLATAGCKAVDKISIMIYPREFKDLS